MRGWKTGIPVLILSRDQMGHAEIAIEPFVREAALALGVNPGADLSTLAKALTGNPTAPPVALERKLRREGVSRRLFPDVRPNRVHHRTMDLILRAMWNHGRARNLALANYDEENGLRIVVRVSPHAERSCRAALAAGAQTFQIDDLPSIPRPECDLPGCACFFLPAPVIPGD